MARQTRHQLRHGHQQEEKCPDLEHFFCRLVAKAAITLRCKPAVTVERHRAPVPPVPKQRTVPAVRLVVVNRVGTPAAAATTTPILRTAQKGAAFALPFSIVAALPSRAPPFVGRRGAIALALAGLPGRDLAPATAKSRRLHRHADPRCRQGSAGENPQICGFRRREFSTGKLSGSVPTRGRAQFVPGRGRAKAARKQLPLRLCSLFAAGQLS